jgi:hypothetical protein
VNEEQGLRMAHHMKSRGDEITAAIRQTQADQHGVVALVFTDDCRAMEVRILDEPYEPNVRIFPEGVGAMRRQQ